MRHTLRIHTKVVASIKFFAALCLVAGLTLLPAADSVWAISDEQRLHYRRGVRYFDIDEYGCAMSGTGGEANIDVDAKFNLGPLENGQERRTNLMKALIADFGLSPAQAAGIVGNFMEESGGQHLPPDINQKGGQGPPNFIHNSGYGWAQWTNGRQRTFIDFAVSNGFMESEKVNATDAANYAYLKHELNTGYQSTITELRKETTPEDAAMSFEATFERAGDKRLSDRTTSARQAFDEFSGGGGAGAGTVGSCPAAGGAAIVGDVAFPLIINKSGIQGAGMFSNGTTSQGGHPYIAFDILVPPGTPVVAFMSGTVTRIGEDRCPGRMISIYNKENDLTISYLHNAFNNHVAQGASVAVGEQIAVVGPASAGCGVAHLHIDAAQGNSRPSCSRLNCPAANQARFVDIGPQLFETYQLLPD